MNAYKQLTEEALAIKAQYGDQQALDYLIKSYKGFISYMTQGYYLKDGDNQDLQQEATIGLLEAIQSFNKSANMKFRNFAYLCIKRELDSLISRSNRKKRKILNEAIPIYAFCDEETEKYGKNNNFLDRCFQSNTPTPEYSFIEQECLEELRDFLLEHLSTLERKVLSLRLSGLSYKEITEVLRVSDKSVDNAMQRLKRKIAVNYIANKTAS